MTRLLHSYLATFKLAPQFTEAEVGHYLLPVEDVICTHVVESHSEPSSHARVHRYRMQVLQLSASLSCRPWSYHAPAWRTICPAWASH